MRTIKKHWKTLVLILVALGLVGTVAWRRRRGPEILETASWGLSFPVEGEASVGNVSNETLSKYGGAYLGNREEKKIYLTFDAGYENGVTEKILDVLEKHQVPAAFFLVGNYLEQNPELVKQMLAQGHTVGNHTYHHYDMSKISNEETFREELQSLEELYREVTGEEMQKYYRPPQGCYSEENLKMAQKMGYRTVFWSLAYVDWINDKQPTQQEAFSKLIPRTHNGAVVLLHSTSKTNGEILDELLTRWKELGYTFGTLDELFSGEKTDGMAHR